MPERSTLSQQLAAYDQHADEAFDQALALLKNHRDYIVSLGRLRVQQGHEIYGTSGFEKTFDELTVDMFEEGADLVAYGVMRRSGKQ